jgi:hypothetical protein
VPYIRALFDLVAGMAADRHGRVTREQLLAAGVDRSRITRWIADGSLRRVHHGVYAVGHLAPSLHSDLMAAVLACGAGAVLSYRSAGHLLGVIRNRPPKPAVTVPTKAGRKRPGIVIHRVTRLHFLDTSFLYDIPITTVPRVLLDLAPSLAPAELTRAYHEAWIRHQTTPAHVEACIARNPTKNGARRLNRALGADVTLSVLEDGFLALLDSHGLPTPRTNIDHEGDKVDCHWPEHELTVELLSYRFHASRQAFEADIARRRRSNHLAYTYGDAFERASRTAAELGRLLGA